MYSKIRYNKSVNHAMSSDQYTNMSFRTKIIISLFVVFFVWLFLSFTLHECLPTLDTIVQLDDALSGVFINWKPPIHSWLLLQLYQWTGEEALTYKLHYFIQLVLYGGGLTLIVYYLGKIRPIYLLSSLLFIVLNPWVVSLDVVGNDALFIAGILCSIGVFINTYENNLTWVRVSGVVLTFSLLLFSSLLRLNAMPALAVLAFAFAYLKYRTFWRSVILSVFTSLALLVGGYGVNTYFINAEKGYPLNYLYLSDMLNVSILRNEWNPYYQREDGTRTFVEKTPPQSIPLAPDNVNYFKTPVSPYIKRTDSQYSEELQQAWLDTVKRHPEEVAIVRLYAFQQVLFAGRSLWFINDWISQNYSGTKIFNDENHRKARLYFSLSFFIYSILTFIVLGMLIFMLFLYVLKKRAWLKDDGIIIALTLALVGGIYICTFIPFSFTSTEVRFYLPHCTSFALALSIVILYTIDRLLIKKDAVSLVPLVGRGTLNLYKNSFLRYIFIGGVGFLIDFSTLLILNSYFGLHYQLSTACGFALGLICVYLLCNVWVFSNRKMKQAPLKEFIVFVLIGLIGLAFTHLLMWGFVEHASWSVSVAKIVTAIFVLLWNYGARKIIIY